MQILSRLALRQLVSSQPKQHSAVVIYEFNKYNDVEDIVKNLKYCVPLEMDDVVSERVGSPTKDLVATGICDRLDIVACHQGVSRSSAIAYLIECQRTSPEEAIKILDVTKHYPNELILKYGMDLLGEQIKKPVTEFYKNLAEYKGWRWYPHNLVTKYFSD